MIPDCRKELEACFDELGDIAALVWFAALTSVVIKSFVGGDRNGK